MKPILSLLVVLCSAAVILWPECSDGEQRQKRRPSSIPSSPDPIRVPSLRSTRTASSASPSQKEADSIPALTELTARFPGAASLLESSPPDDTVKHPLSVQPSTSYSGGLRIQYRDIQLRQSLIGASASTAVERNGTLFYPNVAPGTDAVIVSTPNGVEEFLSIRPEAGDRFTYEFTLDTPTGSFSPSASLEIVDTTGAAQLRMGEVVYWRKGESAACAAPAHLELAGTQTALLTIEIPAADRETEILLDPSWSTTGSLITPRYLHTTTLLSNGKVLVTGGTTQREVSTTRCELYDPATGSWSNAGRMRNGRFGHCAVLLTSGKVLIAGGSGTPYPAATCEIYDPVSNRFSGTGGFSYFNPSKLVRLSNGTVLAIGSWSGGSLGAYVYDPTAGSWTQTSSPPIPEGDHRRPNPGVGISLLPDGTVFYILMYGDVEIYNPVSRLWSIAAHAPDNAVKSIYNSASAVQSATALSDGSVLVLMSDGFTCNLFNASSAAWTQAGSLLERRAFHSATLLANGRVLFSGGAFGYPYTPIPSCEVYDPATRTSSLSAPMTIGRWRHAAIFLNSGKILAVGGDRPWYPPALDTTSCEVFTP